MNSLPLKESFWDGRSVFLTGHTGFKGAWLSLILHRMGSKVHGFSLRPLNNPNLFDLLGIETLIESSTFGDIRDFSSLIETYENCGTPDIVLHLAAQSLVLEGYRSPYETFSTNALGTLNLLETIRLMNDGATVINITTDKVYLNDERGLPFSESDKIGGHDPYAASKGCVELISSAYSKSFFDLGLTEVANVRSGNVIGGGDWAPERLIPDYFRAKEAGSCLEVRSPYSIRPWQHVFEPLFGYLKLVEASHFKPKSTISGAWNFGPDQADCKSVQWVLNFLDTLNPISNWRLSNQSSPYESALLRLCNDKVKNDLCWRPTWNIETALIETSSWYQQFSNGRPMYDFSCEQIEKYKDAMRT